MGDHLGRPGTVGIKKQNKTMNLVFKFAILQVTLAEQFLLLISLPKSPFPTISVDAALSGVISAQTL